MGLIRLTNQSLTDITSLPAASTTKARQFTWAFPAAATLNTNEVKYQSGGVTSTDASHMRLRCPANLTVKAMYLHINGTPSSGSTYVTLMKNNAATSTTITTNTTTGDYVSTTETSFSAGDKIGFKLQGNNTTPHWNHITLLCELD